MTKINYPALIMDGEREMIELGIPMKIHGFKYLSDALDFCLHQEELLTILTKGLYEKIADRNNVTSGSVETGIRRAIEAAWNDPSGRMKKYLPEHSGGVYTEKPTNGEFISLLVWNRKKKYHLPEYGFINGIHSSPSSFVAQDETCYTSDREEEENDHKSRDSED
ncbi:MAG: sporulation initiation factor Spo0A C-terminal domain-containing protein [Eubacteriales bacterium]|nr:sporulation initiation factor Spo0A C-terminal domain-containing protein [Eubacteriales bacterium]